jgi:hypothetical protein
MGTSIHIEFIVLGCITSPAQKPSRSSFDGDNHGRVVIVSELTMTAVEVSNGLHLIQP